MKKSTTTLAAACLALLCTAGFMSAGNATAGDANDNAPSIAAASQDSGLFIRLDQLDQSSDAKFSESLAQADGDQSGDAKCFYWYYSYPCAYAPAYCYYTYYCPVYYVSFRIVTYTVPVVPACVAAPVVSATPCVTYYKSTGKTRTGAVINSKVPANSPLARLGLRSGDIVTSVDGRPVTSISDVRAARSSSKLTFYRGGKLKVAGRGILRGASAARSAAGKDASERTVTASDLRGMGEISMYEYYDRIEGAGERTAD